MLTWYQLRLRLCSSAIMVHQKRLCNYHLPWWILSLQATLHNLLLYIFRFSFDQVELSSVVLRLWSQSDWCIILTVHANFQVHTLGSIWSLRPLVYLILILAWSCILAIHGLLLRMILHHLLCLFISIYLTILIHLYLIEFYHDESILHILLLILTTVSVCWHLLLTCEYHVWSRLVELVLILVAAIRIESGSVWLTWLLVIVLISFAHTTSYDASLIWSLGWLASVLTGETSNTVIAWLEGIRSALCVEKASWIVAGKTWRLLLMLVLPVEGCRRYLVIFVLLKLVLFGELLLIDDVFDILCYFYCIWYWSYSYLRIGTTNVWCLWALLQHHLGLSKSTPSARL